MTALVYAYGHPKFDAYRPASLDRALHGSTCKATRPAKSAAACWGFDDEAARVMSRITSTASRPSWSPATHRACRRN